MGITVSEQITTKNLVKIQYSVTHTKADSSLGTSLSADCI